MRPEDLLDVALERVEDLQGGVRRVLAVEPRRRHIVIDAAGESTISTSWGKKKGQAAFAIPVPCTTRLSLARR